MDPRKKSKLILLGFVGFTLATISITAVYLPFYHGIEHRIDQQANGDSNSSIKSSSMWKNMDERAKGGQRRF